MRAQNTAGKRHRDVRPIVIKEKEIKAPLFRGHCPPYTSSNTVWLKVHGHAPLSQKNLADQSCMNEEHGRYKQKQSGHPKESALFVCACVRVTLIITTLFPTCGGRICNCCKRYKSYHAVPSMVIKESARICAGITKMYPLSLL